MSKPRSSAPAAPAALAAIEAPAAPNQPAAKPEVVWCAAKDFTHAGVRFLPGRNGHPGDVVPDIALCEGFTSMRRTGFLEAWARLSDGSLVPVPLVTKRRLERVGGGFYAPGQQVPGVRRWRSFPQLMALGFFEPVQAETIEEALKLEEG